MKRLALFLFLIVGICGCATTTREATWKTVPEVDMSYDRAWSIVVNAIGERFDLETVDAQSGYLRSGWKVTDTCLAGLGLGGYVPCQKSRVIARVEERNPFKVKIKVEKKEAKAYGGYNQWFDAGNNEQMGREVLQDLSGRLRN